MRVARIPIADPCWSEFVESHPDAGPLHLPAWTSVIADCYGFPSFALVVTDAAGGILAGSPCVEVPVPFGRPRWVSLSFSDACPLLVRAGVDAGQVTDAVTEYALAAGISELVVRSDLPAGADRYPVEVGYIHRIAVPPNLDDLHVRKNHRNMANRAARRGVMVARGTSAQDLATFYHLHTLTRQRLGVPVQPRRFFELLRERLLVPGRGFIATATLDGEPVSSALYLSFNGILVSKYHATGPRPNSLGEGHMVDWEAISHASAEGHRILDMGRSDPDADGLRLYKAGWGGVEEPLVYTHISREAPRGGALEPGDLAKRIVRNSPPFVCRALGEILYRWTA